MKKLIILLAITALISCKKEEEKRPIHSYWEDIALNTTHYIEYSTEIVINAEDAEYTDIVDFVYNSDTIHINHNITYRFFINYDTKEITCFDEVIGTTDNYKVVSSSDNVILQRFETY